MSYARPRTMEILAVLALAAACGAAAAETTMAECQRRVDAAMERLQPAAAALAVQRSGSIQGVSVRVVRELRETRRQERTWAGEALLGAYDDSRRAISISLAACDLEQETSVLAHEFGHAVDFATTTRRYSASAVVLMPKGEAPLSKEEAADEYGRRILYGARQ
jgi:hypothetical protein